MWTYRCPPSASPVSNTDKPPQINPTNRMTNVSPSPVLLTPPAEKAHVQAATPEKERNIRPGSQTKTARTRRGNGLVGVLYLSGLGCGIAAVQTLPQLTPFLTLYGRNLAQSGTQVSSDMLFSAGFLGYMGILMALLLAGMCAFGSPLVLGLIFLRGLWESAYIALLCTQSMWQGILLYTLVFWLPGLLSIGFQLQFAAEALRMSRLLRQNCLAAGSPALRPSVKRFWLRFLTFGALGVAAALLQVAFFLMFGKFFI